MHRKVLLGLWHPLSASVPGPSPGDVHRHGDVDMRRHGEPAALSFSVSLSLTAAIGVTDPQAYCGGIRHDFRWRAMKTFSVLVCPEPLCVSLCPALLGRLCGPHGCPFAIPAIKVFASASVSVCRTSSP